MSVYSPASTAEVFFGEHQNCNSPQVFDSGGQPVVGFTSGTQRSVIMVLFCWTHIFMAYPSRSR